MSDLKLLELAPDDFAVIHQCLRAAADGPFFPEWEIQTLTGFSHAEIRLFADSWPPTERGTASESAAWSCLNNLLGYPHGCWERWSEFVEVSPAEVRTLFDRWIAIQDPRPPRPELWSEEDLASRRPWLASIEERGGDVQWPDTWPDEIRHTIEPFLGGDDLLVITFPSETAGRTFRLHGHVFRHTGGAPMIVANRSGAPNVYPITFGPEVPTQIELLRDNAHLILYPPAGGADQPPA